jgi:hypothetical protein
VSDRTPEQINRAIADALGWTDVEMRWQNTAVGDSYQFLTGNAADCDVEINMGVTARMLGYSHGPNWHGSLDAQERDVWPMLEQAGLRLFVMLIS